jgi:hypothetical protein
MTKITKTLVRVSPIGVIVSSILIAGCVAPIGARGGNAGVATNNMTDAARQAVYGSAAAKGVADNNMSDAARQAVYGTGRRVTPSDYTRMSHHSLLAARNRGVATNNMSDAARKAVYGSAKLKGVADNNMSDAARKAVYGNR